jgi:hypothetical protein
MVNRGLICIRYSGTQLIFHSITRWRIIFNDIMLTKVDYFREHLALR